MSRRPILRAKVSTISKMMIKPRTIILLSVPFFLMFACAITQKQEENICKVPPEGFSEDDLWGTWVARRLENSDTLIFREDGKYKQIIHIETPEINYESDWNTWKLHQSDDEIPRLYLDGMRLCVYLFEADCERIGTDGGVWWDMCSKKAIEMPTDKGVVMVLGVSERIKQPSRGILLILPMRFTDGNAWIYEQQE